MLKVDQNLIKQMNELYLKIGTYAGVSRELGGSPSPSTVKKYIIPDYVAEDQIKKVIFKREDMPKMNFDKFKGLDDWGTLCELSKDEKEEIKELWKEISI